MEPEAQLIAAQAAEELARQQATGTVDELQRGRMAQQILGGAAQQAKAREAQQKQAEFARRKRLGDIVAAGEAQKRLQDYQKETQRIGGMFQAGLGAASTLAAQGASYLAEQNALAEGLKAAEAEGGVQGAVDFLNANPDYDPGEETLQRLYAGSEMGQQDAANLADALESQRLRTRGAVHRARTNRQFFEGLRRDQAEADAREAERSFIQGTLQEAAMRNVPSADEGMPIRAPIRALTPQEQAVEDALAARRDREILANRVADARMQKIAELGYDPALELREQAIMRENTPEPLQPYAPEATPIQPIALTDEEDAVIEELLRQRQQERLQRALPQSMIDAIIAAQQRGRM
tara:strand:- start:3611 stop:4663 length:1053 start_codon:yes stop_codon:yes gene_type:complete